MLKISAVTILTLSTISFSSAQEFQTSNFSGTFNTTVTSGFTLRTERNCENLSGYTYVGPVTYVSGSGEGCATKLTDAYGNTTTKALSRSSGTNDDGSMNFDSGDVVSATQKFYSEVLGSFSNGIGLNLSFTGFVDPATDINSPTYAPLTKNAESELTRGFDVLNAYVYGSSDFDNTYVDWTIGRQVTNWGEATFIPIGMNGFTTNALDLTKLRGPGSTIREALIPNNQITVSTPLSNGMNVEAFVQLEHRPINFDPAGSFYGSEIIGTGGKMITNGMYNKENKYFDDCNFTNVGTVAANCTAAVVAEANTVTGDMSYGTTYLLTQGLQAVSKAEAVIGEDLAQAKTFGSGNLTTGAGAAWADYYTANLNTFLGSSTAAGALASGKAVAAGGVDKTFYTGNTTGYNLITTAGASVANSSTADADGTQTFTALAALDTDISDDSRNTIAAVSIRRADDFIKEARDDGQYGIRLSGYSDAGSGFDWSLNYSRFHSKTPYLRVMGQGGVYSGDLLGIITAAGDASGASASQVNIKKAIANSAYSAGVCNAVMGGGLAGLTFAALDSDGTYRTAAQAASYNYDGSQGNWNGATSAQKAASDQFNFQDQIAGYGYVHNSAKCHAKATAFTSGFSLALAAGDRDSALDVHAKLYEVAETLVSAITPLNMAKYDLIYPEDLDAVGVSFNTNLAGTAIQGEITFRPEFPLAHNASDQVAQIGDVAGSFDLLDMFAFDTVTAGIANNTNADGTDLDTIVAGATISPNFYNPTTTGMTAAQIGAQQIRMYAIGQAQFNPATGAFNITSTLNADGVPLLGTNTTFLTHYKNWMNSTNSSTTAYLGLAGVRKGVFDAAYVAACGAVTEDPVTCGTHTLGNGSYVSGYANAAAVVAAYEGGTVAFNRSSLPSIAKADTVSNYFSTPFVRKDVWSYDLATTTTFSASHPITTGIGADSVAFLTEFGAVSIADMNNATDGYIARNGYQEGIGQEKCNGPFGALVAGGLNFGGAAGALTHLGAGQVDGLFGNGGYCEDQNGADDFSVSYRLIGTATYNNFNNSGWSVSPSVVWAHDPYGYGPASLGGFVEDKMTMSLSLNAKKGDAISLGLNYTAHLEGPEVSATTDKDTLTASMSYSF
jgi:hypothetical protein